MRMSPFNWTHSWTVHSGMVSGNWPLLSRLQSKSSPKHAQGGGHVLVFAADAHWSLNASRKTPAKLAKLRAFPEEHISPPLATQENPSTPHWWKTM